MDKQDFRRKNILECTCSLKREMPVNAEYLSKNHRQSQVPELTLKQHFEYKLH